MMSAFMGTLCEATTSNCHHSHFHDVLRKMASASLLPSRSYVTSPLTNSNPTNQIGKGILGNAVLSLIQEQCAKIPEESTPLLTWHSCKPLPLRLNSE